MEVVTLVRVWGASSSSLLAEAVSEASSSLPVASFATTSQRMEAKDMKAVAERTNPSMEEHGPTSLPLASAHGLQSAMFFLPPKRQRKNNALRRMD